MNLVDVLVPGVSTMTSNSRYFGLYWALASYAHDRDFDTLTCRTVLRRAEVALAMASVINPHTGSLDGLGEMHGADTVRSQLAKGSVDRLVDVGERSYSPRAWGYWSQYKGPIVTLGLATTDQGAFRKGPRETPVLVRDMFRPLLELAASRNLSQEDAKDFIDLTGFQPGSADLAPLRAVLTATGDGINWNANDSTRRSTYRILARAVQLAPDTSSWTSALVDVLAYGPALDGDPVFIAEGSRAKSWRGLLLRHRFVGAWRHLWSRLVDQVWHSDGQASRSDLHEWVRGCTTNDTVEGFLRSCTAPFDARGNPAPAEVLLSGNRNDIETDIGVLLIGSVRGDELAGVTLDAFRGNSGRNHYLDPQWVAHRRREYMHRPLTDFACAVVDDMLDQSHRVALAKMYVDNEGRMKLPTKLHERNGLYFATGREGPGNVGLRTEQLGELGRQLGLFRFDDDRMVVTELGVETLGLPQ
ncbi:hypothetical protein ACFWB0_06100 [Rhodococcus sp. NPDC060086]|uniref:hypothetical protein n=1 Tax=Rhodococcus sp. NPDC060086 TaxID=3347055 RepID=UPI00365B728D